MKTKITISLLATASFLFNANILQAQTCGTSQVTYSGYTSNFLPKWNATTGCISNSIIYDSGDRIGFGLTAPASLLHSSGQIRTGIPYGGLGGASATTGALLFYNASNTNTVNIQSGVTTTSYSLTLPSAQGAGFLSNNGSGGLDWLNVGFWGLTGNMLTGTLPASPTEFIGTINAADWIIRTNNTEKARVTSTGKVGIGINAPAALLHLYSTAGAGTYTQIIEDGNADGGLKIGTSGAGASATLQSYRISTSGVDKLLLNPNGGNVGIGTTTPTHTLDVTGNARVTGQMAIGTTITGGLSLYIQNGAFTNSGTWGSSDIQLKKDTSSFTDGLNIIKQIHPINYRYNGKTGVTDTNQLFVSVVAQQLQTIAPYTIKPYFARLNDPNDTTEIPVQLLSINTQPLLFASINAIKELAIKDSIKDTKIKTIETSDSINTALNNTQQQSIDSLSTIITSLQNQLNQLSSMINDCCNSHGNGQGDNDNNLMPSGTNNYKSITQTTLTNIELSNKNIVVLNQNVPNPFAEQTTISYYLPDNVQRAQILFFEQSGKIIKTVDLKEKGKGTLNVFANDLSNGIYTYTLIVDGQTVETKKMVKQ